MKRPMDPKDTIVVNIKCYGLNGKRPFSKYNRILFNFYDDAFPNCLFEKRLIFPNAKHMSTIDLTGSGSIFLSNIKQEALVGSCT